MRNLDLGTTLFTLTDQLTELFATEDAKPPRPTLAYARRARVHQHDAWRACLGVPSIFT